MPAPVAVSALGYSLRSPIAALASALARPGRAAAADPCNPVVSVIACENSKPGTPQSQWDISGAGSSTIQGFATDISVNVGGTISFKIKTPARSYRLDIYRMGYYQGNGARLVATVSPSATLPADAAGVRQPDLDRPDRLWQLGGLGVVGGAVDRRLRHLLRQARPRPTARAARATSSSSSATTPATRTCCSRPRTRRGRPTTTTAATASTTGPAPDGRAWKVSYNRPFNTRGDSAEDFVFNAEYPMVRWLEANGYDVSYFTERRRRPQRSA